ncbi:MAG: hypothetical protein Tsb005_15750 [Gammaproteobacteria bacterium]
MPFDFVHFTIIICFAMLSIAMLISVCVITFAHDTFLKLISLELIANILVSIIALWAFYLKKALFFDIIIAIALIIFLSTVAMTQFILSRKRSY